uniref:Profilin n=2 Tax=Latimeria chalumnae TaxID=7897 RepID=H3A465_LATCH
MAHWKEYVNTILKDNTIADVAIVGLEDKKIWASKPEGVFLQIAPQEIDFILKEERKQVRENGIKIGGKKYSVIRDNLTIEKDATMDLRLMGGEGKSVCIAKTGKALLILMGQKGVHGGILNKKAFEVLRKEHQ